MIDPLTLLITYLSISYSISIKDDPFRKFSVDVVILAEGFGHAHLQIVHQFLPSKLKHYLRVVPEI